MIKLGQIEILLGTSGSMETIDRDTILVRYKHKERGYTEIVNLKNKTWRGENYSEKGTIEIIDDFNYKDKKIYFTRCLGGYNGLWIFNFIDGTFLYSTDSKSYKIIDSIINNNHIKIDFESPNGRSVLDLESTDGIHYYGWDFPLIRLTSKLDILWNKAEYIFNLR